MDYRRRDVCVLLSAPAARVAERHSPRVGSLRRPIAFEDLAPRHEGQKYLLACLHG